MGTLYSHSRLSSYENCPQKFAYRYIDKIEVTRESIESFVGKRVHELLERLYHHVARYGKPPSLAQMQERFRRDWMLHWHDDVEIVKTEFDLDHYRRIGERCLANYYRSHYPFDGGETIGIEKNLQFRLDSKGDYQLRGIVDRIVRSGPGRYEIHDYKTGGYLPPQSRIDQDRQLALYQIGLAQTYGDVEEVELVWHYLVHNKTLRSHRTRDALDDLSTATMQLIDTIEAATEFPATTSALCRWCEYRDLCPAQRPARSEGERPARAPAEPAPAAVALPPPPPPLGEDSTPEPFRAPIQLSLL